MALGRLFQRHGAATENALSPSVLSVLTISLDFLVIKVG